MKRIFYVAGKDQLRKNNTGQVTFYMNQIEYTFWKQLHSVSQKCRINYKYRKIIQREYYFTLL